MIRGTDRKVAGGFTLIELMIAITIIGILCSVAIPAYIGVQKKAVRTEFKTNLDTLRLLEEKRYAEFGSYAAGADTAALKTLFPDFQPGDPAKLKYDYNVVTTDAGQGYVASATGKADTSDDGVIFSVDETNTRVGW